MSQPAELEPVLMVTVVLDGDDDPAGSLANVVTLVRGALEQMVGWGAIRAFTIEVRS